MREKRKKNENTSDTWRRECERKGGNKKVIQFSEKREGKGEKKNETHDRKLSPLG